MVSKLNSCPQNGRKSLPAIHQTREWYPEYTGSSKTKLPQNQLKIILSEVRQAEKAKNHMFFLVCGT
jgi:hypothetical protein